MPDKEVKCYEINDANHCPNCGEKLDAASGDIKQGGPEENDISICFYCFAILIFNKDLSLRLPNEEEAREIENADFIQDFVRATKLQRFFSNKRN